MSRIRVLRNGVASLAIGALAFATIASLSYAKEKDTTPGRLLTGKVLDRQDNPVPNAIVYLTDTRSRAVKTFIVGENGLYRFVCRSTLIRIFNPEDKGSLFPTREQPIE